MATSPRTRNQPDSTSNPHDRISIQAARPVPAGRVFSGLVCTLVYWNSVRAVNLPGHPCVRCRRRSHADSSHRCGTRDSRRRQDLRLMELGEHTLFPICSRCVVETEVFPCVSTPCPVPPRIEYDRQSVGIAGSEQMTGDPWLPAGRMCSEVFDTRLRTLQPGEYSLIRRKMKAFGRTQMETHARR